MAAAPVPGAPVIARAAAAPLSRAIGPADGAAPGAAEPGPDLRLVQALLRAAVGVDGEGVAWDPARRVFAAPPGAGLSLPESSMVARIGEAGWLTLRLQEWCGRAGALDGTSGLVRQALAEAVAAELSEHSRLVSALEGQLRGAAARAEAAGGTATAEGRRALAEAPTLRRLTVWLDGPVSRLRSLCVVVDATEGLDGATLASAVWKQGEHGSGAVRELVRRLLQRCTAPLLGQLRRWCLEGEVHDEFGEFFVEEDPAVAADTLWQRRFRLRRGQCPVFFAPSLCEQALLVGKSVAFLREACGDADWVLSARTGDSAAEPAAAAAASSSSGRAGAAPATGDLASARGWRESFLFEERGLGVSLAANAASAPPPRDRPGRAASASASASAGLSALESLVGSLARRASARVLSVMVGRFRLREHLGAVRRYLLLARGDFVQELMRAAAPQLSLPAAEQHAHVLLGVLDGAVRSSSAQHDDSEFVGRLNVNLLPATAGDTGWDVLSLTYDVAAPLSAVLHPLALRAYERLFAFLWRVKRAEWSLSNAWCEQASATARLHGRPELARVLHRAHLLRADMGAFASTLSSYCMFEVLETSWKRLGDDIDAAEDLPAVIRAHDGYLRSVARKALLTGGRAERDVSPRLQELLDHALRFARMHRGMFRAMSEAVERCDEVEAAGAAEADEEAAAEAGPAAAGAAGRGPRVAGGRRAAAKRTPVEARTFSEAELLGRRSARERRRLRCRRELRELAATFGPRLDRVAARYRGAMLGLLAALDSHGAEAPDAAAGAGKPEGGIEELRFLFFRFDFNEYYSAKFAEPGALAAITGGGADGGRPAQ